MEPIVFEATDGEVYATGAVRLRLLMQSPDQPIAITDNTVPPGFPGPVRSDLVTKSGAQSSRMVGRCCERPD
jgi:hypothetical protein